LEKLFLMSQFHLPFSICDSTYVIMPYQERYASFICYEQKEYVFPSNICRTKAALSLLLMTKVKLFIKWTIANYKLVKGMRQILS
jgi:hypothetical protein